MTKFEFKPRENWQLTPDVLIPATHLHLNALQLFLPYNYQDMGGPTRRVRWSEIIAGSRIQQLEPELSFFQVMQATSERFPGTFEHKDDSNGVDAPTAAALNEHMAGFGPFFGCDWAELEEDLPQGETIRLFDTEHVQFRLPPHGLTPTARIPQFLVDSAGKFAWGSTLYPDCLYIASTREVCGNILADERLDAVRLW